MRFPACLATRYPYIGISTNEGVAESHPTWWTQPKAAPPMDECLEARQIGNPVKHNSDPMKANSYTKLQVKTNNCNLDANE